MSDVKVSTPVSEGVDAGVPWHFGDPLREQRIALGDAGVVDRSNRAVLVVPGDDRLEWLHSICSQHVSELADGESTEALVLSPHGHVEQDWQLTELAGTVWIDTEPGDGPAALDYLQKMRFLKRVEPADVTGDWAVLTVVGPATAEILGAAGWTVPEPGHAVPGPGGGFARRRSPWSASDVDEADLVVPRGALVDMLARLRDAGAEPVGMWAYDAIRVAQRRPRLHFETDHRTIPHEVGWIGPAVHLNKGCYRGQETVARVHNLGKPPRRLVRILLGGESDVLPSPGTAVELDGRAVGFVGTAVQHYEWGPVALAVVKRNVPDDAALTVAGHAVAIDPH